MSEEAAPEEGKVNDVVKQHQLPDKLNKLYLKAQAAMELRNWGYAISLLQAVLKQEPGFLQGRKEMRLAAIKENEGKKSIKLGGEALKVLRMHSQLKKDPVGLMVQLEKDVLSSDPYNAQGNELLYQAALAAGLPMTAGYALETVIEGDPDNIKFYHKLGDFYMEREAFDEAAKIFNKVVEKDRTDLEAAKKFKDATAKGSITSQKWDSDGDWRDLLKDKDAAKDLESAGRAAMTRDQLEERAAALSAQYGEDPNNIEIVKQLASTYEALEDFSNALQFYEWAFQLSANDPALEKKVGQIREIVGKNYLEDLRKFVEENPDHPDIEQYRAQLQEAQSSQLTELIAEAEARVERNPTDPELRYELGQRLLAADRHRDAIKHLQQAKTSPSLRIKVMNMLGQCYDKMNMTDLAVTTFQEAIAELQVMDDTKKDLLYNQALLYEKLENQDGYLEALKQIYAVDYGYRDVADRVEQSYG